MAGIDDSRGRLQRRTTIKGSKWWRLVGALLAVASAGGCASAGTSARSEGKAQTPADAPHQHAARAFEPVHIPQGREPDPARGGPTSLRGILIYADNHAPRLQVARQQLGLGDAAIEAADTALPHNPELTVGAGPRFGAADPQVDLRAALSQRLEIAGERGLRVEAAEHTRARYAAELDEVRWEVHRDVHAAFHRALIARERRSAQQRLVAFQERLLEIARGRVKAGDVSPLVIRLAEGELAQARVAAIAAEQEDLSARLELGALAGWPTTHPPEPAGGLDEPRDPPSTEVLLAETWRHQPRLRSLEASRAEADAHARSAARDGWPEPTVGVEVAREGAPAGMSETVILGTITVPLPLAQRNQGARALAAAASRVAEAELEAFASQLAVQVAQHRSALVAAASRLRAYGSQILPTFEENLRLIQRAYEVGEIDIMQVTVAREQFLRIQADALSAYADYFQAVADLEATTGTDLWPDEQHEGPAPEESP